MLFTYIQAHIRDNVSRQRREYHSLKVLKETMGHESVQTTKNMYTYHQKTPRDMTGEIHQLKTYTEISFVIKWPILFFTQQKDELLSGLHNGFSLTYNLNLSLGGNINYKCSLSDWLIDKLYF